MIETCTKCGFAHDTAITCLAAKVIRNRPKEPELNETDLFPPIQHGLPPADVVVAEMARRQRQEMIRQRTIQPNISRKDARKRNAKRKQAKLSRSRNRRRK